MKSFVDKDFVDANIQTEIKRKFTGKNLLQVLTDSSLAVFSGVLTSLVLYWMESDDKKSNPMMKIPQQFNHDIYRQCQANHLDALECKKLSAKVWNMVDEKVRKVIVFKYLPSEIDINDIKDCPDSDEVVKNYK